MQKRALVKTLGLTLGAVLMTACASNGDLEEGSENQPLEAAQETQETVETQAVEAEKIAMEQADAAEKAAQAGVDGLILVTAGAGGHAGLLNPMAFVNEIKTFFKGTILLSGCMSTGQDVATAMQMGADLAYMGTRFINTNESRAGQDYQQMINESKVGDIVYTAAVSGVNANFMKPSLENNGITEEMWSKSKKIDFGSELDAAKAEAKAWKTVWSAGQGVTSINDSLPTADLISRMKTEFNEAIERQKEFMNTYG